jgi:hypothetical protein
VKSATLLQPGSEAEKAELTLAQLIELLGIPAPDSLVAGQVRSRGIAFPVDGELLKELSGMGAGQETLRAIQDVIGKRESTAQVSQWIEDAERLYRSGDHSGAFRLVEEVLKVDPRNSRAGRLVGTYYLEQGEWRRAQPFLENALAAGEQLRIRVQHFHDHFIRIGFCRGELRMSRESLEFSSIQDKKHNFSVPLGAVSEYSVRPSEWVMHFKVKVEEEGKKKTKDKNYDFASTEAEIVDLGDSKVEIRCYGCEDFLVTLYQLTDGLMTH